MLGYGLLAALAIGVLYYVLVLRPGRIDFWRVASRYPDEAFAMFISEETWVVFTEKPPGGYRSQLSEGDWVGPFKLWVPSIGGLVSVFGRSPGFETSQERFMARVVGSDRS